MPGESVSLYFGLKDGETADLEIISAAAIAWVETMRALAQAVDPKSDVKVELIDVDQSSAIYNTVVEWFDRNVEPHLDRIAAGASKAAPRSRALVVGLAAFTVSTAIPTLIGDGYSDDDRERMKRIEEQTQKSPAVETARQKFYRAVEREPAIRSIEIREDSNSAPIVIVTSDAFPIEGGLFSPQEEGVQERVTPVVMEVVLVKPALVHTPRTWTFKPDGLPEFDAVMRDAKVLQAIKDKGFPEQMREGIRMTIRLEVKEVLVDGQWKLIRGGRSVMRVISPKLD
jgi:type II secretory pathway component PulM